MVAIDVVAGHRNGRPIRDLMMRDFQVREDGKPQAIRYFNRDNNLPLHFGLLLDTSSSQQFFYKEERDACAALLHSLLVGPEDQAFLVRFDSDVILLQPPTADVRSLDKSLNMLDVSHRPRPTVGGTTLLYHAVAAASQQISARQMGRHALILVTDGVDEGSVLTLGKAVAAAEISNTPVYVVVYRDAPGIYQPNARSIPTTISNSHQPTSIEELSNLTGGRLFVVSDSLPAATIFAEIETDLRTQYRLGYTPPPSKPGTHHRLEVKCTRRHTEVRYRTGYFTPLAH